MHSISLPDFATAAPTAACTGARTAPLPTACTAPAQLCQTSPPHSGQQPAGLPATCDEHLTPAHCQTLSAAASSRTALHNTFAKPHPHSLHSLYSTLHSTLCTALQHLCPAAGQGGGGVQYYFLLFFLQGRGGELLFECEVGWRGRREDYYDWFFLKRGGEHYLICLERVQARGGGAGGRRGCNIIIYYFFARPEGGEILLFGCEVGWRGGWGRGGRIIFIFFCKAGGGSIIFWARSHWKAAGGLEGIGKAERVAKGKWAGGEGGGGEIIIIYLFFVGRGRVIIIISAS